jgi:hypothetical protein
MGDESFHHNYFWEPYKYSVSSTTTNKIKPNPYRSEYIIQRDMRVKINGEVERPKEPYRRIAEIQLDEDLLFQKIMEKLKAPPTIKKSEDKTDLMFDPENLDV